MYNLNDGININEENDLVTWYYRIYHNDGSNQTIAAITCDKYIDKYLNDLSVDKKASLNTEYYNHADHYLCPDTPSFVL